MFKLAIATALTLAAFSASAQMYGEIGVTATKAQEKSGSDKYESSPAAIRGIFGYEIHPNFAIEGLAAFGVNGSKFKVNGESIPGLKFKVDSVLGVYAKPKVKFTPELEGFVRAGFAQSKLSASLNGQSGSASESSFSYGLGMNYALSKTTSLNVDYMSYFDKNNTKITGLTFGVGYKF